MRALVCSFAASVLAASAAGFTPQQGVPRLRPDLSHGRPASSIRLQAEDGGEGEISFAALQIEVKKRTQQGANLGKTSALQRLGPHHTTTPRDVVEFVISELGRGNISRAFEFTAIPAGKRGTHQSSTSWTRRMAWEKCRIIGGAPSGLHYALSDFEAMMKTNYNVLLESTEYRFLGDSTPWQQKEGRQKMTAPKEYVVEVKTGKGEHQMVIFRLVYDWLVYCHLVASVSIMSTSTAKHFPGAEDESMDI
jgi:hypothetical protein